MKGIKHECQLMERCDGHDHGGCISKCGKVRQLFVLILFIFPKKHAHTNSALSQHFNDV